MPHKLLIVDDDMVDRQAVRRAIVGAGLDVQIDEAVNGDEAETAVRGDIYDCVFLDYRLPGECGYGVLDRLRQHIEPAHTPVIVLTGVSEDVHSYEAIARGAHNFLRKNQVTSEVMKRAVGNAIELTLLKREKQKAEDAFRNNRALLETATEIANLGCWEFNMATLKAEWSDGMYRILGLQRGDVEPGPEALGTLAAPESWNAYLTMRQRVIDEKITGQVSFDITRRDGTTRSLQIFLKPVINHQDEVVRLVGTLQDVTDQQESQKALERAQRMEALGQFSGGVAHDFNNLLGIMIGHLGLLKRSVPDDPKASKRIDTIQKAAERGARLVRRMLAFSRRSESMAEIVEVNVLLRDMREMLSKSLTARIDLEFAFEDDVRATEIDPGDLEDAIINLVINARDAMPDGGRLKVTTSNLEISAENAASYPGLAHGDYIRVAVIDTGTGMTPHVLERAMEPFFSTKEKDKGTGLGLSMVYGFARRCDGHVHIESRQGEGTCVCVVLPAVDGVSSRAQQDAASDHMAPKAKNGKTVLVVDDEHDLANVAAEMLGDLGYRTVQACDVNKAIEILESGESVDLVFSDVIMPGGKSGFDLAMEVSHRWPDTQLLLTSGYTNIKPPAELPKDVLRNMLPKPYTGVELADRVDAVLKA